MKDVFIAGVGQTPVTRNGAAPGRELAAKAIGDALHAAGIEGEAVDSLFVGNMTGAVLDQQQQMGSLIADYAGLSGIEAVNVEAACASGAAAARLAYLTLAGGMQEVAVVCGIERMTHRDRDAVTDALAMAADRELESSRGESFLSLNARLMQLYFDTYDKSGEEFAPFAINAHANAMHNPNAVFHKQIDLDDYLESRMIIEPVRLYDVSPTCNGAAAVVLATADAANRMLQNRPRIRIAASSAATAPVALDRRDDLLTLEAVRKSTLTALDRAGFSHDSIDLFELHDAYTIMSALCLESAGFTPPGTATEFARDGRIARDGDLPISMMGGLKARGHPVGATGVYQLAEGYLQLAQQAGANQIDNATTALLQNIGGTGSTVVNHILTREA
ncbi:MAG TPA: beta-ketoacyl synthase N-terminal-like domain-containing protein [Gammaproteobacteria bacterium]